MQKKFAFVLILVFMSFGLCYAQDANVGFQKVTSDAVEKSSIKEVEDAATSEALGRYNEKMTEIGKSCPRPEQGTGMEIAMADAKKCICARLPEVARVLQAKINAFADLLKRRPELANEMVTIKGQFEKVMLRPEDFKKNAKDSLDEDYHCPEVAQTAPAALPVPGADAEPPSE